MEEDYLSVQKKRGCIQTELLLELKEACNTDENQASDEDMMKHEGCLTRLRPCGFTCHDSRRPCH